MSIEADVTSDGVAAADSPRSKVPPALAEAVARLDGEPLSSLDKGFPSIQGFTIGTIANAHLSVSGGDLPTPTMVLRWDHVLHNISVLQNYCDANGAWLAPHGKTTMAP